MSKPFYPVSLFIFFNYSSFATQFSVLLSSQTYFLVIFIHFLGFHTSVPCPFFPPSLCSLLLQAYIYIFFSIMSSLFILSFHVPPFWQPFFSLYLFLCAPFLAFHVISFPNPLFSFSQSYFFYYYYFC